MTVLTAASAALAIAAQAASLAENAGKAAEIEDKIVRIVERISPAYVRIGGGSGVVISPDGWMLTNHHVVAQFKGRKEWQVFMPLRKLFNADLYGLDVTGDIALLKIRNVTDLPCVEMADSDAMRVGQYVIALGDPFSFAFKDAEPTVTMGIVSALHFNQGTYSDAIQTDAPLNPGNSGGPLLDLDGKLVGINGRVLVRFGQKYNTGIGLAIPSNQIKLFLPDLKKAVKGAEVFHGQIYGIKIKDSAAHGGSPEVTAVSKGSNADAAGLRQGDVIVEAGGLPSWNSQRLWGIVHSYPCKGVLSLVVLRGGSREKLEVELQKWFPGGGGMGFERPPVRGIKGPAAIKMTFSETDPVIGGAEIDKIDPGSGAARAGLKPGDIVLEFDGKPVKSGKDIEPMLEKRQSGDKVKVKIMRGIDEMEIELELDYKPSRD